MSMRLNAITGGLRCTASRLRVGRGIGSGLGKTCGRGHKGQKSRSGGTAKPGFEGGQMPLYRRLPKFGFVARKSRERAEVSLRELASLSVDEIDLAALQEAGLVGAHVKRVKVILSGDINKAITLRGLGVTAGAKKALLAAGGKVE